MMISQIDVPRVSVVMPVYNSDKWLGQAIDSILHQSLSDFELIVVDDGSTDGSRKLIDGAARSDSRIRIAAQPHLGVTAALNRGIALARSEVIARMDADDISYPDRLQKQLAFLDKHPGVAALGSWANVIDERGRRTGELRPETEPSVLQDVLEKKNPFVHSSMMMSASMIRGLGGYRPSLDGAEDYDLWLRISERAQLANLPEPLINYRRHSASASASASHKQLIAARLAQMSAATRRTSRTDFVDKLDAPISLQELEGHEALKTAVYLHCGLSQRPDEALVARNLRRLAFADLNHAERKAIQLWLMDLMKSTNGWSIRCRALFWLLYLHPPRGLSIISSALRADSRPE